MSTPPTPGPGPGAGPDPSPGQPQRIPSIWRTLLLMLIALALFWLPTIMSPFRSSRRIDYSTFIAYVDSGRVSHVDISDSEIRGALRSSI